MQWENVHHHFPMAGFHAAETRAPVLKPCAHSAIAGRQDEVLVKFSSHQDVFYKKEKEGSYMEFCCVFMDNTEG